ncbi:MAG: DinB family protein [Clostridia bacterium]
MSTDSIQTAKSVRQITLHHIQSIPEELFDVQPQAFNNTIRWNVGHIVASIDAFFSLGMTYATNFPETYKSLFSPGTKPADWTVTPPTKDELVHYLAVQLDSLSTISPDVLNEQLKSPFEMGPLRFETVGEIFNFAFIHEAMHLSTIGSLVKVIKHEKK